MWSNSSAGVLAGALEVVELQAVLLGLNALSGMMGASIGTVILDVLRAASMSHAHSLPRCLVRCHEAAQVQRMDHTDIGISVLMRRGAVMQHGIMYAMGRALDAVVLICRGRMPVLLHDGITCEGVKAVIPGGGLQNGCHVECMQCRIQSIVFWSACSVAMKTGCMFGVSLQKICSLWSAMRTLLRCVAKVRKPDFLC
eukprot:3992594-Ditylum_brightwellii.AAC.1